MEPADSKNTQKSRQRSCAYPLFPLSETVLLVQKINEGLGLGPFSRLALARGLGYSSFSGAVSARIGSLVHFGLLSRKKGFYSMTGLAKDILEYPSEISLPAIAQAAKKPVLFQKLIDRFSGASLPGDLASLLETGYGITAKAAPQAAVNFIQTMEFAGLLKDGELVLTAKDSPSFNSGSSVAPKPDIKKSDDTKDLLKIELPSGITVSFPSRMSYKLSLGGFAQELKDLDRKAGEA